MGGDKEMNPVLKMRKKQKEKEREKRREVKMQRKRKEDDVIDPKLYNPNTINSLKNKGDVEHYDNNPLSWNDLQMNMLTGSFNHNFSNSYQNNQGFPGQNSNYNQHHQMNNSGGGQYNRPSQPAWKGDTLSSQPLLYNQAGAISSDQQPEIKPKPSLKDLNRNRMVDENDPLNPHKAKQNFKEKFYGKDEPEEKDKVEETKQEVSHDIQKELDKIKGSPVQSNTKFRPAALRKRKKTKPEAVVAVTESVPIPTSEPPIISPSVSLLPIVAVSSNPLPAKVVDIVSNSSNSSSDSSPRQGGGSKITSALDSLMNRYD